MSTDKKLTTTLIEELGEFGLIEHLCRGIIHVNESTIKGIGDDCCVIDAGNRYMLVTTDMLVHRIHFDLMYTPLMHLGYKAITSSISDICAMNGIPRQVFVSIALSSQFSVELVEQLYSGIHTACKVYEVDLAGGDTTTIESGLVINITATGDCERDKVVYRNGAKENDLIVVSGDLGAAYLGLLVLQREKEVFLENPEIQPQLEGYDYPLRRQLRPEARKDIIGILDELRIVPTAMIDISDGLSSDIMHICKQSEKGCVIFEEKIPLDPSVSMAAREFNLDPSTCTLNGGEDYELLFTINQGNYEKIKNHPDFTVIGYITNADSGIKLSTKSGNLHDLKAQGWKVFNKIS